MFRCSYSQTVLALFVGNMLENDIIQPFLLFYTLGFQTRRRKSPLMESQYQGLVVLSLYLKVFSLHIVALELYYNSSEYPFFLAEGPGLGILRVAISLTKTT